MTQQAIVTVDAFLDGIEGAAIGGKLPHMLPNYRGIVTIQKAIFKHDDYKKKKPVIIEFLIKTTNMPVELPVGTKRSWYRPMADAEQREKAMGELKQFLMGVMGIRENQPGLVAEVAAKAKALIADMVSVNQPFYGMDTYLETLSLDMKEPDPANPGQKKKFTVYNWSPAPTAEAQAAA